jgi:sugar transferase (PEP-CTERM system associated)
MALKSALLDGGALFAATSAVSLLWMPAPSADWVSVIGVLGKACLLSFCCVLAFYYNDFYNVRAIQSVPDFTGRLLQSLGVAFIVVAVFYQFFPESMGAPFVPALLIIVGLLLPIRGVSYVVMRRHPFVERVLIVGTSSLAQEIVREISSAPHLRHAIVGVVADTPGHHALGYPLRGPLGNLKEIIDEVHPHRIVVALEERRGRLPVRDLLEARMDGTVVEEGVELYERLTGKIAIESLTPSNLIFAQAFKKSRLQLHLHRAVSLAAAVGGLLVAAPFMAAIAIAIKLDSRGPILFRQGRTGLGGRPFDLVKFRTMRDWSGTEPVSVWGRDDDARITRVGRLLRLLRLDELPQFWNILKGDMDLVGPRPEIACNVATMARDIPYYSLRHTVRPGITGWAQIKHGYSVSLEDVTEKMRYDLYYLKNMSLWLDFQILVDTVKIVLSGRGSR